MIKSDIIKLLLGYGFIFTTFVVSNIYFTPSVELNDDHQRNVEITGSLS